MEGTLVCWELRYARRMREAAEDAVQLDNKVNEFFDAHAGLIKGHKALADALNVIKDWRAHQYGRHGRYRAAVAAADYLLDRIQNAKGIDRLHYDLALREAEAGRYCACLSRLCALAGRADDKR